MRPSKHDPSRRAFLTAGSNRVTAGEELHVSSLVVHGQPHGLEAIEAAIESLNGAEVHGVSDLGKLVVTLETDSEAVMLERIDAINRIEGVISVAMVFHQVDDEIAQE